MFSHVSVILFTGGFCPIACWDPPWSRHTPPGAVTPLGPGTPPPGAVHAGRYGQQAGVTHPTGMHSSYKVFWPKAGLASRPYGQASFHDLNPGSVTDLIQFILQYFKFSSFNCYSVS